MNSTAKASTADLERARKVRQIRTNYPELIKAAQVHAIAVTEYRLPQRAARKLTEGADRVLTPHDPKIGSCDRYNIDAVLTAMVGQAIVDLSYSTQLNS